jgi:hypothetical protein
MKSPTEFRYAAETSGAVRQQHENVHWAGHNSLELLFEVTDMLEKFEGPAPRVAGTLRSRLLGALLDCLIASC